MSAPIYRIPAKVRAMLRERGCSVQQLAVAAGLPVRGAQWALSGHPRGAARNRMLLASHLTQPELTALGWTNSGMFVVEHFAKPAA